MRPLLTKQDAVELQSKILSLREQAQAQREHQESVRIEREAARAQQLAAERVAFKGDCFDCRDTGVIGYFDSYAMGKPCEACQRGRAIAEERRQQIVSRLIESANMPVRCVAFTLASYPAREIAAYGALVSFLRDWDGRQSLMLKGAWGTGKTGLMAGALREVASRFLHTGGARPIHFTTGADLLDALRQGYDDGTHAATLARAKTVGLLAIDDLGVEKPSEWVIERLFVIINARYEACLPTFVTTNYGLEDLAERIGPRSLERLMETSRVITVEGQNLRRRQQTPSGGK